MSSLRIAEELRARIVAGELKPGARVPSARQIMRKWGVANATASKALTSLAEQGLVRAIPGVGTVVEQPVEAGLSQARIVALGLFIADREGLAAVTMRRIASELRVATMSLYRYVPGKEELVMLLSDAAFGEQPLSAASSRASLRARLSAIARAQWTVYCRHPWLAGALSLSRPQLLPQGMHYTERTLAAMDGLGLSAENRLLATLTLIGFVRGAAVSLEMEAQARNETGTEPAAHLAQQEAQFLELAASGAYPRLVEVSAAPQLDVGPQRLFEFGLDALLDGLCSLLQARSAPAR